MLLLNFGSILNFAEEIETQDKAFYEALTAEPTCSEYQSMFEQFAKDAEKNIKTAQRTRRENVTEMILEGIQNFSREPFLVTCKEPGTLKEEEALSYARSLEERAECYYQAAADKMKAQPEVSRALKLMGKKRTDHLRKLEEIKE